jgi:hypothetical protein
MRQVVWWRLWFSATLTLVAICLLGSVWEELPLYGLFPVSFNAFYVAWWFFVLILIYWASLISGLLLLLLDDRRSVLSRVIWSLAAFFFLAPLLLVVYWVHAVELPEYRARKAAFSG